MRDRASREKAAYNQGLQRELYEKIFRHCNHYPALQRQKLLERVMARANDADVLEIGSQAWTEFIQQTAIKPRALACINISESELEIGRRQAQQVGIAADMQIMDAHELKFADASFDVVYGSGILHHLDFETALREITRVLRPGGVMVFFEPLDNNQVGRIVRAATPKARTPDETPLRTAHLDLLNRYFDCEFYYEQLLAVPAGVLSGLIARSPDNWLNRTAHQFDQWVLRKLPGLGPYYRHVAIVGHAKAGG